ncbi:DUF3536 domain-containing protein, partial [Methanoculleus chikugoensis]|uniref:DUF3536 domain-containing protein n=1 Tax=Methanoculleus chikugoensis TaxID=118126 RepID=UPI001FB30177
PRTEEALAAGVRGDAVDLVLDRWSDESVAAFFSRHAPGGLSPDDRRRVLFLLEIERQAMLMQTSCGWFFDDITEPGGSVQVMRHAKRAMDLARQVLDFDIEAAFVEILRRAPVNDPGYATSAEVYDALVRPAAVDLPPRIAVGAALYALFGLEHPAAASGDVRRSWRLAVPPGRRRSSYPRDRPGAVTGDGGRGVLRCGRVLRRARPGCHRRARTRGGR